ncbi:rod-determining factor RdfA [Natrinema sp. H-ect4]|uniref:rod-determining factor RdfA n=1 Tax=Natrinema sp. H-ect4 TaxID=3242699 RepID=UPI0035A848F9
MTFSDYYRGGTVISDALENEYQCPCKIGGAIDRYDLDGLNGELLHRRDMADASLLTLAEYSNERILETALAEAETDLTDVGTGQLAPKTSSQRCMKR